MSKREYMVSHDRTFWSQSGSRVIRTWYGNGALHDLRKYREEDMPKQRGGSEGTLRVVSSTT